MAFGQDGPHAVVPQSRELGDLIEGEEGDGPVRQRGDHRAQLPVVRRDVVVGYAHGVAEDAAVRADHDLGAGRMDPADATCEGVEEAQRQFLGHVREGAQYLGAVRRLAREGGQYQAYGPAGGYERSITPAWVLGSQAGVSRQLAGC